MGNANFGICRYGWCIRPDNSNNCKENHTSTPRFKAHKRNLSAAFNIAEQEREFNVELLNINLASEEELMTLPGVNRTSAHGIVEYRAKIGAFKRIEDLALVVGATKFGHLRQEICVGRSRSSQDCSINDLSLQDNISRSSSKSQSNKGYVPIYYAKINVNNSNVFQLMKVKGVSQHMAENIVAYRDRKGPFRKLDELLKVKGIKHPLLSAIRPQLVLSDDELSYQTEPSANGIVISATNNDSFSGPESGGSQAASHSPAVGATSVLGSQEDLVSMYGPIARKSFRSKKKPFIYKKNNQNVLRVASWNLQQCDEEKTENPGVLEVIAMTILENGFSILAIQEVKDKTALQRLCNELNSPTIPNVKKWPGHRGQWKCVTSNPLNGNTSSGSEYCGFIYDGSRGITLKTLTVLNPTNNNTTSARPTPAVGVFWIKEHWEVVCVNLRMKPQDNDDEDRALLGSAIGDVLHSVDDFMPGEKDIVLLGDFGATPDDEAYSYLKENNFRNVLTSDEYTNISTRNPEGNGCTQNIWLGCQIQRLYTETKEVVREGMTSPWIPDGWGWGGVVSSHCPVYAELYIPDHMATADNNANKLEAIKLTLPMSGAGDS